MPIKSGVEIKNSEFIKLMRVFIHTVRTVCKSGVRYGIARSNLPYYKTSNDLALVSRLYSDDTPKWGSKKQHRKVKLHFNIQDMADPKMEEILAPLRASVKEQVGAIWLRRIRTSRRFSIV